MAFTEITAGKVFYLTTPSIHTDITGATAGSLAIYVYASAPNGEPEGSEWSYDGANWIRRNPPIIEKQVSADTGGFLYEGFAQVGVATSAASWRIRRSTIGGSSILDEQQADGNLNYDNIWDNRESLVYS